VAVAADDAARAGLKRTMQKHVIRPTRDDHCGSGRYLHNFHMGQNLRVEQVMGFPPPKAGASGRPGL
jgi:hypothetical protein